MSGSFKTKFAVLLYRVSECPSFEHNPACTCYKQAGLPLKADLQSKAPQSQSWFIRPQEYKTVQHLSASSHSKSILTNAEEKKVFLMLCITCTHSPTRNSG